VATRNQPPAFTGLPANRLQSRREEEQAVSWLKTLQGLPRLTTPDVGW